MDPNSESTDFGAFLVALKSDSANEVAGASEVLRFQLIQAALRALDDQRTAKGLTKAELARRAGLDPVTLRRILTSPRSNPRLDTIVAIANGLDLELTLSPKVGVAK